jgi:phage/plasmid primase-like uncharacterized protein
MIAKKIPKVASIPDNYKELAEYIAAAKEPGEKLDKFWIENCGAGETLDDLEMALREVYAVRLMKPEVIDKSYHMMVSFRPGEKDRLSEKDLKDIASTYAKALGFAEHQYVAGTHINTDNFHMHIAFNKIHPKTLQVLTPFRDYKTLDRVSRKLEKEYGLFIDNGMAQGRNKGPKLSPSARDYEAQTWQESFQNHVLQNRKDILDQVNGAGTWEDLHKILGEYDIGMKKRGNGFVLVGPDGQGMKASAFDRKLGKAQLEKKLGVFEPPAQDNEEQTAARQPLKRPYKKRPSMRHPRMSPLWRRYLNMQKPMHKRSTLVSRTISNWKLFLLSEAYRDPMAMVLLIAQQEFINLIFGDDRPTPLSKMATPALAAWRQAGNWADAKSMNWMADTRYTGRGCRTDDAGNLLVPFKDARGYMQSVRIYSPNGKSMQLGNSTARNLTHLIDSRKRRESGPVIYTTDYADAVKIHDATRRPVVVVADPKNIKAVIQEHQRSFPKARPILALKAAANIPGIPVVQLPKEDDTVSMRRTFAKAIGDDAFLAWDACTEWAKPDNSPWLKRAGLRGYGVKITPDGDIAVPLKDRSGRLENVMLINQAGNQRTVLDPVHDQPHLHIIDPQWRKDQDTIFIALDYAAAATIHRASRCPVVVPEYPDQWGQALEQMRLRYNDARIVVALDTSVDADDKLIKKYGAEVVRPERAHSFKEYAVGAQDKTPSLVLATGTDNYNFDPDKSESGFVQLQGVDGAERYLWGVDIADAVESSGATSGDWILLEVAEQKKVTVQEEYRDKSGELKTRTITTHRNIWKASIEKDPATVPTMTALRNELAETIGDDGWLAWNAAARPEKRIVDIRPEMGRKAAWAGFRVDTNGNVLIPLRDGGNRLSAVYKINQDGSSQTLAGGGSDKGLHHVVGGPLSNDKKEPILIADDLVSAIELNRLTKKPVVWSVHSENLEDVGKTLRRYHPDRKIVIAATDAHMASKNQPLENAKRAAEHIMGDIVLPPLGDLERKRKLMTFGEVLRAGEKISVKAVLSKVGVKLQKNTKPKRSRGL